MLTAELGISGGNTACAETGHVTIVSNEGNIRMATTMPRVHIVLLGIEKIAATLEDHDILLRMLTRAAAGQKISTYVSYVGGPRLPEEPDGPEEFHLVLVDNGRSRILADPDFREVLHCVRCGGCLNVCPVYVSIGGHSYGSPYCGPIGAVFTPLTQGINKCHHLCQGETLCGACKQVCPVDNDLPRMLSLLRAKLADGDRRWNVRPQSLPAKLAFGAWSVVMRHRGLYDALTALAGFGQNCCPARTAGSAACPGRWAAGPGAAIFRPWPKRVLPSAGPAATRQGGTHEPHHRTGQTGAGRAAGDGRDKLVFAKSADFCACANAPIAAEERAAGWSASARRPRRSTCRCTRARIWPPAARPSPPWPGAGPEWGTLKQIMRWSDPLLDGLGLEARLPADIAVKTVPEADSFSEPERQEFRREVIASYIGITTADYLLADTASLVLLGGRGRARSVSLVPSIHIAVVPAERMLGSYRQMLSRLSALALPSNVTSSPARARPPTSRPPWCTARTGRGRCTSSWSHPERLASATDACAKSPGGAP
jgi:L-lactate utilization protein LutB